MCPTKIVKTARYYDENDKQIVFDWFVHLISEDLV